MEDPYAGIPLRQRSGFVAGVQRVLNINDSTLGNADKAFLREKCVDVAETNWTLVHAFAESLSATMQVTPAFGLAAPQVGIGVRMMIIMSRPTPWYPDALQQAPIVLTNPRIVHQSERKVSGFEGCLSVPGLRNRVIRPHEISVDAGIVGERGQVLRGEHVFKGLLARVFLHELDHLDGVFFCDPDRAVSGTGLTEQQFQEFVRSNPASLAVTDV